MSTEIVRVFGTKNCGSVIAEAFLTLAGIPFEHREVLYDAPGPGRDELLSLNPLGQVPTLVLPNGTILTETLAVAAYADRTAPEVNLIPKLDEAFERFWRWSVFLIAAVYPTFTYGDEPAKWVSGDEGKKSLRESTDRHRETLWKQIEAETRAPFFLGEFSAIDIYISVMTHWRPGPAWFQVNCPKLVGIASRVSEDPRLTALYKKNF